MKNSFRPGMEQLKYADFPKVRREIMAALDITSRTAWSQRMRGLVEPKKTEIESIEAILKKYGVTKNIWGN